MNTVQATGSQNSAGSGNQSAINLRGLGTSQTLVLVDGRRIPSISLSGTFAQGDINGIPLSLVERIEVLPATASGIYGGGATGGVINIITRRGLFGCRSERHVWRCFDSGAASHRIDLGAGFSRWKGVRVRCCPQAMPGTIHCSRGQGVCSPRPRAAARE